MLAVGGGYEPVAGPRSRVTIAGPAIPQQTVMLVCGGDRQSPAFLSVDTPLGQALMGRKVGDEFDVETDAGRVRVMVLDVRDPSGKGRMVAMLERRVCELRAERQVRERS